MDKYKQGKYYSGKLLSEYVDVNPKTDCRALQDEDEVSFVPMQNIDEKINSVRYNMLPYGKVKKGFTVFKRNDLIWAKITPCMQNGKSCIVSNMPTDIGFGSTEFHVVRNKSSKIYMPFLWAIFSNDNILKAAQAVFSGTAGQQRVPAFFIENFPAIVPPIYEQKELCFCLENALIKKNNALQGAYDLRKRITKSFADSIDIKIPNNSCELYSATKLFLIKNYDTRRMDPKCYSKKFEILRKEIASSPYKKYTLKELILSNISGDWGKDDNITDENSVRCLVLRSTEISNKHNIEIREDKVQFRLLDKKKFESMQMEIGDIIVEKSGGSIDQPVGRVVYLDRLEYNDTPIAYSNFLTKLKLNRELVDPYYLFEYLRFVYNIGLTEVMQNQTNGIRNLIVSEFLTQTIIVPENNKEIGLKMKAIREQAKMMELEAEQEWQMARAQFEKGLLGEQ